MIISAIRFLLPNEGLVAKCRGHWKYYIVTCVLF